MGLTEANHLPIFAGSSKAERLICNQQVVGSNPTGSGW